MVPFKITEKKTKYLGINLTYDVESLYDENYKPVRQKIADFKQWRNIPCAWMGRVNIFNMSISTKAICTFTAMSINILRAFFTEMEK